MSFFVFFYQLYGPHQKEAGASFISGPRPGRGYSMCQKSDIITSTKPDHNWSDIQCKSVTALHPTVRIIQRTPLHTWLTQASSGLQVLLYVAILCILSYNYCACGTLRIRFRAGTE